MRNATIAKRKQKETRKESTKNETPKDVRNAKCDKNRMGIFKNIKCYRALDQRVCVCVCFFLFVKSLLNCCCCGGQGILSRVSFSYFIFPLFWLGLAHTYGAFICVSAALRTKTNAEKGQFPSKLLLAFIAESVRMRTVGAPDACGGTAPMHGTVLIRH